MYIKYNIIIIIQQWLLIQSCPVDKFIPITIKVVIFNLLRVLTKRKPKDDRCQTFIQSMA